MLLHISEDAAGDIQEIFDFWREKTNPETASRLLDKIKERFSLISRYPRIGISRPEYGSQARCLIAGDYLIYYQIKQRVEILRVLHGARDQRRAFKTAKKRSSQ